MSRTHRRRIIPAALLIGFASAAIPVAAATAPAASPAADCLFNWAETQYATLLTPSGGAAQVDGAYYYRAYANGTYLGVGQGRVWLLASGQSDLSDIGSVAEWLASAGCATADTTAPTVTYTSRSDGAVDAAVNSRIVAAFSEPIEITDLQTTAMVTASTIPSWSTAISVKRDDGTAVAGTASYDTATATLYFDPASDLDGGRTYTVQLDSSLRDFTGNLLTPYSWQFKTVAGKRNTATQNALQAMLDKSTWQYAIPGSTMALLGNDGSLWTAASGYADLTTREPMTADKLFRMGSNTKTFVGTAVLQLVDEGKVSLGAPINTYLSYEMSTYMPAYDGNTINVRHLMNHTSGMFNFTTDGTWGNAYLADAMKRYYPQELLMIANAGASSPTAPVYGQFTYSNTNYVLLGLLLHNAGGSTYEDTVRSKVIDRLGLTHTIVPNLGDAPMPAGSSHGYWEDTETGLLYDVSTRDPSTVWSSGDMIADIADLAYWGKELGQGNLLSASAQQQRLTYVTMNDHLQYGLGIVRDTNANLIGHQGGMIGYTSQTYYMPDVGATIAFFYNRTLALHDYSDVMTYKALKYLWPDHYGSLPDTTEAASARKFGPVFKPGFLTEY
jgi:D-alanyl-D-alanine carboxypeptidase